MVAGRRMPVNYDGPRSLVANASQVREVSASEQRTQEQPLHTGNLRNRFRPLAKARVSGVLVALDYFAQLAQRNRYHYTNEEIQILEKAILDKVADVFEMFRQGRGNRPTFEWEDEKC